ncbi:MAG: hypothetical protein HC841_00555 [Verrucomicrobiae bacterium]|nr:hypothetical protein [Verrucomicrobiae bacterium]
MTRSAFSIVRSDLDIKFWLDGAPDINAVRPAVCPCCQATGGALGGRFNLVGHGVRLRQLRGPLSPGDPSTERVLFARRFRCRNCSSVVLVAPRVVVPGRHYAAPAIAGAFARFGVRRERPAQVEGATRGAVRGASTIAGGGRWTAGC